MIDHNRYSQYASGYDFYMIDYAETMHMNKELNIFDKNAMDDGDVHFIIAISMSSAHLHMHVDICTITATPALSAAAGSSFDQGSSDAVTGSFGQGSSDAAPMPGANHKPAYPDLPPNATVAGLSAMIRGFRDNVSDAMEALANSVGKVEAEATWEKINCPACKKEIAVSGNLYQCDKCNHKWIVLEWYATCNHLSSRTY